jgi:hypothetical protein
LDAWDEHFDADRWWHAFDALDLDPDFYAKGQDPLGSILPWEHLSSGMDKCFLLSEFRRALNGQTTPDCRTGCLDCGMRVTTVAARPVFAGDGDG